MSQAGERTEEATPKRLEKARKDGKIISSRWLSVSLQFVAGFWYFSSVNEVVPNGLQIWKAWLRASFDPTFTSGALLSPSIELARQSLLYCVWAAAFACASMLSAQLALSQGYFSLQRAKPDFSKLFNPSRLTGQWKEGLKSLRASIAILLALVVGTFLYIRDALEWTSFLARMPLAAQLAEQGRQLYGFGKLCCLLFLVFAAYDLVREMRRHSRDLKMTKQEIREEYRDSNGRPEVKAKIRKLMKEYSSRRMMQKVPLATVVITNPTHYAVAIQYKPEEMSVPLVLAKGADHLALRIRKLALERQIPIIENPPLAQALYKAVEPDQEIPLHLYRAVAEVLAYVYRVLDRKVTR